MNLSRSSDLFMTASFETLASLPLEARIGQLLYIGLPGTDFDAPTRELLEEINPGGVIIFGRNVATPQQLRGLVEDVRKDEECTDTVGIFLQIDADRRACFRVTLGPQVQTLTRALAAILCQGFEGAPPEEILAVPADFVPKIVGAQLVRLRSQTVYYLLNRMKSAVQQHLAKESSPRR